MSSRSRERSAVTLDDFLKWPEQAPYLEFHQGRVEPKVSPRAKHSLLTLRVIEHLNGAAEPSRIGLALPELRCTFGGRSIIPDIVFLLRDHIALDPHGEPLDDVTRAPDLHIEIISPKQDVRKSQRNLKHSLAHGCPLGWMVHPDQRTVRVFRPGEPVRVLGLDGVLEGGPVLPGLRLPVSELFGWLRLGTPAPGSEKPPADPGIPST